LARLRISLRLNTGAKKADRCMPSCEILSNFDQ
jgi:hypothetical protein